MTTARKILSVVLALTLWGQAVAVDYLHHHLVTGIPDQPPLALVDQTGTAGPTLLASCDADSGHGEATCPFCLFLQNFHGSAGTAVFSGPCVIYTPDTPAALPACTPQPGHLDHAGPRAPPALQV